MHQKLSNLFNRSKELDHSEIFIIAEIGKNFIQTEDDRSQDEYVANAKQLIDEAYKAGVDAVKFQTHEVIDEQAEMAVISPHFKSMERYRWLERNTKATPIEFWHEIKKYAEDRGLIFFSSPMSRLSASKLDEVGVPLWKIGSGDVDDFFLLDYIIKTKKPVIISSGMVSFEELDRVMKYLTSTESPVGLLYCVSQYPCPPEHFNLATIEHFKKRYPKAIIGFSDHSVDNHEVTLAAVKLGARIIEKHFSLSRDLWGPDHKASLSPKEFKELVDRIRSGEYKGIDHTSFYGLNDKELEGAHNKFRPYFKKTLVASCDIPAGTIIKISDLRALRPRLHLDGLSPEFYKKIIGKKTKISILRHTPLREDMFQ